MNSRSRKKANVLAILDRAIDSARPSERAAEIMVARAATADLIRAANALVPTGKPKFLRMDTDGTKFATLAVREREWRAFVSALNRIPEEA